MKYSVEISQIGRRGTALLETNFGLIFTVDLYRDPKVIVVNNRPRVVGIRRERIFELLSPCHGAKYDLTSKSSQAYHCHVCKATLELPKECLEIELSHDSTRAAEQLEPILEPLVEDAFEAIILTNSLVNTIEDIFDDIKNGRRLREVVKLKSSAEV